MDKFCQDRGLKLTALPGIFIAPIALYSKKIKDVKELKKGDTITIPNDPTNGGRALQLLAGADLLKLKEGVGHAATVEDIIDNPLRLRIMEVEAATLPRTLDDARAAVINKLMHCRPVLILSKTRSSLKAKILPMQTWLPSVPVTIVRNLLN